jgi:eukaryotic-like serine/threonine-protein kinase
MPLQPGTRLGHFDVVAPIGAGGMGEVYRARDVVLGRDVAIKVISEALVRDETARKRLEREARAVASLSHPNILVVHEFAHDREADVMFVAAELLEGETLRARIERSAVPWRRAGEIAEAIAAGLAAAHARGIIHRDLKPENIFLTSDGRVKILDFGLARQSVPRSGEFHSMTPTAELDFGSISGTFGYMSPEQARGESIDGRSDIFSLGCILFEMIVGKPAFRGRTGADTIVETLTRETHLPEEVRQSLPPELVRILDRCLARNVEQRFQSASDLAFDLGSITRSSDAARATQSTAVESIAVLPFENASDDPGNDYLSDGLTESIINRLSAIPSLRVMARSTVFRFKGQNLDPREAGRALNVRAVLAGGVNHRQGRLMVRTELVDVDSGAQLWGERYVRNSADLLEVEDEIAREISERLRLRLTGEVEGRLARRAAHDTAAYHAYLKGRYWWFKRTEASLYRGLEYFREALEIDPTYALAWVGVADSYNIIGFYSLLPPGDAFPKAGAAAEKALALDTELAEAHTSLGYTLHHYGWDFEAAADSFSRAIELQPAYPQAHQFLGMTLMCGGRQAEAIARFQDALRLDPLSLLVNAATGWCHYYGRDYVRAAAQLEATMAMDEHFGLAHLWLAWVYLEQGRLEDALSHVERREALAASPTEAQAMQALIHARAGERDKAVGILVTLQQAVRERFIQPYELALVHIGLGEYDEAFQRLQEAVAMRSHRLTFLRIDPKIDPIRGDSRYRALEAAVHPHGGA